MLMALFIRRRVIVLESRCHAEVGYPGVGSSHWIHGERERESEREQ